MSLVRKMMMWSAVAIAVTMIAAPAYAADKVSFMLDWYPNPDHAPIYVAQQKGYFADQGITLDIMVPADPNDPLKLVAAGQVDLAISYQPSVTMARSEGLPVVSIGSLVQHPLSSILYLKSSGIKTPADFKGKKIGYSVEPLYRVLFEAVAENSGLKKTDYEAYRVGFNLVPPLLSGKIDAAVGSFRNVEAIQVELEGHPAGVFAFEDYGVPDFYELVIIANPDTLKKTPSNHHLIYEGPHQRTQRYRR
jgi:putative hydroxymethylpyrimidine transport system substrate-binding protein